MAVKAKISKSKRNNQKKNKLVKQGVIKKARKTKKDVLKDKIPKITNTNQNANSEEDSDQGEDLLDMVEDDDLAFLKSAITNRSYNIYNRVRYSESAEPESKKRKFDDNDNVDTLESAYEEQNLLNKSNTKVKPLLPIKTKGGVIPQERLEEISDEETSEDEEVEKNIETIEENNFLDEDSVEKSNFDISQPISSAQLLVTRNEVLRQKKIHIGTLSSGLLENPEEKVVNLRTLLNMMEEDTPEVFLTVRKLVIVSLLEVFKDILPSYEIKKVNSDGVKLKKDTLKLQKYEENLLLYYKKFLQKLEKYCFLLIKKKGDTRDRSEDKIKLSILAVQAMCELLVTHPYFNFSQNIAQAIVPFLNSSKREVREIVKDAVKTILKEDKKEDITLKILRIINSYLKNHAHNAQPDILEVLLVLNLKDVNLDKEKEQDLKQKKLQAHKSRLLQLSKKERKRQKKLKEVEKELMETKAEENIQTKQKNLTEITKVIFNIYFRILKNSSNSKVLGVCLEGLAKFAHCINLEFYVDIVNTLDNLLKGENLGYRERLHCIRTVFAILSGQGEVLNLDPTRFYNALYTELLKTNVSSKNSNHILILVETLCDALIKRRKKITNKRTIGFVKRLATLSLQLSHDGCLGCLGLIKNILQLNKSADILLDCDLSVGDGKFLAEIDDPEYSNASGTALYEMITLKKHYHPIVNKFARNIASGVPATGEGSLPGDYGKCSPEQLFINFDMSKMAFNPAVPIPKQTQPKTRPKRLQFADSSFEEECVSAIRKPAKYEQFWINEQLLKNVPI